MPQCPPIRNRCWLCCSFLKEWIALLLCRGLRLIERFIPPRYLRALLWPLAAVSAWWELTFGKLTIEQFRYLPASLRPACPRSTWQRRIWQERTKVNLAKLLCLWPDRLGSTRWRKQCRCIGWEAIAERLDRGSPVVLASLHYGPHSLMRFWMRACGIPATVLLSKPSASRALYRQHLDRVCDEVGGLAGMPHVFGLGELRDVVRFLQSGRLLFVASEGGDSRHVLVQGVEISCKISTGALRLAARANAEVVPCLIQADHPWGFTIHFGKPVPKEWIQDQSQHHSACYHLLEEFAPILAAQPEQCGPELLTCFRMSARQPELALDTQRSGGVV